MDKKYVRSYVLRLTELCYIYKISFVVPSKPRSLEILSVNSSTVTLQWIPPEIFNGVITHYSIQLDGTNIGNFSSSVLMYTIEGLSPDTLYALQLRAHTGAGAGQSNTVTFITCKLSNIISSYIVAIVRM